MGLVGGDGTKDPPRRLAVACGTARCRRGTRAGGPSGREGRRTQEGGTRPDPLRQNAVG